MLKPAVLLICLVAASLAQEATAPTSDPLALTKLTAAQTAFAGAQELRDVRLEGTVIQMAGTELSGTFVYEATADGRAKLTLSFGSEGRTEIASGYSERTACSWTSQEGKTTKAAHHNCLKPAGWLLPLLAFTPTQSSLIAKTNAVLSTEMVDTISLSRNHRTDTTETNHLIQRLSSSDLVLDKTTNLPIGFRFVIHADNDFGTELPVEISYAEYRDISGVKVPHAIRRSVSGSTVLRFTVTSAQFNTGTEAR